MDIEKELRMLQALRDNGTLTASEFDAAVEKQISEYEQDHDPNLQSPQAIAVQRELTRLDHLWTLDRQKYSALGRFNTSYVPNKAYSLIVGVGAFLFGSFWVLRAINMTKSLEDSHFSIASSAFPIVGGAIACAICWRAFSDFRKAGRYEEAKAEYWHQRDVLVAQQIMH